MKTILHIGSPKTGTTALQHGLHNARERLLEKGALYPFLSTAEVSKNHGTLSIMLLRPERLPRIFRFKTDKDRQSAIETALQEISYQIAKNEPDCLILSSEYFFRVVPLGLWPELLNKIPGCDPANLQICCYIRKPSAHYLSMLQQKLKASHEIAPPAPHNFRRVLESYQEQFPDAEMSVRPFERGALKDGDILADFCTMQMAELEQDTSAFTASEETNISLSTPSMIALRDFRLKFFPDDNDKFMKASKLLIRNLVALDQSMEIARPRLRAEIVDQIDYCDIDPVWLKDTHSVVFQGFDYDRAGTVKPDERILPISSLREVLELDIKVFGKLLARLRKRAFIQREESYVNWVDDLISRKDHV
jgi:hypothetical protein